MFLHELSVVCLRVSSVHSLHDAAAFYIDFIHVANFHPDHLTIQKVSGKGHSSYNSYYFAHYSNQCSAFVNAIDLERTIAKVCRREP